MSKKGYASVQIDSTPTSEVKLVKFPGSYPRKVYDSNY